MADSPSRTSTQIDSTPHQPGAPNAPNSANQPRFSHASSIISFCNLVLRHSVCFFYLFLGHSIFCQTAFPFFLRWFEVCRRCSPNHRADCGRSPASDSRHTDRSVHSISAVIRPKLRARVAHLRVCSWFNTRC